MSKDIAAPRMVVILLFVITFVLIGHTGPILYATYTPADNIIDIHGFEAEDTTVGASSHELYLDRTVSDGRSAEVITSMFLLNEDGEKIEVESNSMDRFLQEGRDEVIIQHDLPENLEAGSYQYVLVAQIEMANGRVTRTVEYTSEKFVVSHVE